MMKAATPNENLPIRPPEGPAATLMAGTARWGGLLGDLIFRLDRPHRVIARRNLSFAFPEWSREQVAACTRRVFRNIGRTIAELARAAAVSHRGILHHDSATGTHHLYQALEQATGIILVSAHLGNWEIGLQDLGSRVERPIGLVVRPISPAILDRWLNRQRSGSGNRIIYKKNAFPAMMKTMREGGIIALMVDMSVRKQSVPVRFFGHRARASHAAALLAARSKAVILPMFSYRRPDGRLTGEIGPPVPIARTRHLKSDLTQNTQALTDIVEAAIRRHPDQYFWIQKRWKDYHPELYPGYRPRPLPLED
ncbi:MAG: hypothetical protein MUF46_02400 [Desulfobacterales bacterium]|jgi:KDO2-lipid IV(A) lauroyltransferase|nr:hypothetical protein [Desulfobacterales bacterium]